MLREVSRRTGGLFLSLLMLGLLITMMPANAWGQKSPQITTLLIVRHGEKAAEPANDPPLNDAGIARAENLARLLGSTDIAAIYVSEFLRTQATAQPLAKKLNLSPIKIEANKVKELVDDIVAKQAGKTIVIVSHSNTIPKIIELLGGDSIKIEESEYDNLYIVSFKKPKRAKVVRLIY
jgi:2,3-bisphosphoglycerate-dependent phosphoglycerate mutase